MRFHPTFWGAGIGRFGGFFPILSNTTMGLKSADHNLRNLFDLYHANRWQRLIELEFPSALPYLLAGVKISGGLALIGAVVAEFVAGSGSGTGLAWRIIELGKPSEYSAHVRGATHAVVSRRVDFLLSFRDRESAAEELA